MRVYLNPRPKPVYSPYKEAVYVATTGNDSNDGTLDNPLKTLGYALDFARASGAKSLLIRGGTYRIGGTLRPPAGLTIKAYRDERVTISGGTSVSGWAVHSGDVIKAPRTHAYRQLYVNGAKAILSRSAFYKILHWWDVEGVDPAETSRTTGRVIAVNTADYQAAGSPGVGTLFVLQRDWSDNYLPILSANTVGAKTFLKFTPEAEAAAFNSPSPVKHSPYSYHFENLPTLAAGHWYYDNDWVYYRLKAGELLNTIDAIAPVLNTLLEASENNITIEGIEFKHSNYFFKLGKLTFQGDAQIYLDDNDPRMSAAIKILNCLGTIIRRCRFSAIGALGIEFGVGTKNATCEGNYFNGIAGAAVSAKGPREKAAQGNVSFISYQQNPPIASQIASIKINNNKIINFAQEYYGCTAIFVAYCDGYEIEHNEIGTGPYSGISIGWGWYNTLTYHRNGSVQANKIENPMTMLADGGGIYTLGRMDGTKIIGNYVNGIAGNPFSFRDVNAPIYLDAGTENVEVRNNHHSNLSPINGGSGVSGGAFDLVADLITNVGYDVNIINASLPDNHPNAAFVIGQAGLQGHWDILRRIA